MSAKNPIPQNTPALRSEAGGVDDRRLVGLYRCAACGQAYERESDKAWIKSYCEKTGKNVRLQRTTWDAHKPWLVKFVRGLGKPNTKDMPPNGSA